MNRTGVHFEMTTETFTLENMFAMELHKYIDVINEIVGCAVKELSIEKVGFPLSWPLPALRRALLNLAMAAALWRP